jgi:hypothetical protein
MSGSIGGRGWRAPSRNPGGYPKYRGFIRSAQSSPGHPMLQSPETGSRSRTPHRSSIPRRWHPASAPGQLAIVDFSWEDTLLRVGRRVGDMTSASRCCSRQIFVEANAISEGIGDFNTQAVVERLFDSRSHVTVASRRDVGMKFLDAGHPDENR